MDARQFLGIEPDGPPTAHGGPLRWHLEVTAAVSTPGRFLFGGCGLAAGIVALEAAASRPTVWATAQYLAHAPTGSTMQWEVVLPAVGKHTTQARAVGRLDGQEIISVNAALGRGDLEADGTWVTRPQVPEPEDCPIRAMPAFFADSVFERVEERIAKGRLMAELDGTPGDPHTAIWARVPGHLEPSAATLAILGDWVTAGLSPLVGRPMMSRSLDNTLRVVRLVPTEWVLCDIRMHALAGGYGHGIAHLWAQDGTLLATASQSMSVRHWPSTFDEAALIARTLHKPDGASTSSVAGDSADSTGPNPENATTGTT